MLWRNISMNSINQIQVNNQLYIQCYLTSKIIIYQQQKRRDKDFKVRN